MLGPTVSPALLTRADEVIKAGMSAIGTKQTWAVAPHMSAFGSKADMGSPAMPHYILMIVEG